MVARRDISKRLQGAPHDRRGSGKAVGSGQRRSVNNYFIPDIGALSKHHCGFLRAQNEKPTGWADSMGFGRTLWIVEASVPGRHLITLIIKSVWYVTRA